MSDVARILEEVAEGTAPAIGDRFFSALVEHLAKAMSVRHAFVAEFADHTRRVRTLSRWEGDGPARNIEYDLAGTPCERVVKGELCRFPDGVQRSFPDDELLVELGVSSYLGVPLVHPSTREHLGHLAVMDCEPMSDSTVEVPVFRIFAARATAELMRIRAEERFHALGALADTKSRLIGDSAVMRTLQDRIALVAPTDSTVAIYGETGTGKELVARAIHERSHRRDRAFVKINCAALPETLVESELFGHEPGAFTGATGRRLGRFELADRGTIFLDEIGDMPASSQAKLLRVLQEGELERLGGTTTLSVDVRVLCATNRDLRRRVADGEFREDLFYRLDVFPIVVPPLRDRREDIPSLVAHLIQRLRPKLGRRPPTVDDDTMRTLAAHEWPGNVRELENVLERATILSTGAALELPSDLLPAPDARPDRGLTLDDVVRRHITSVLARTRGVIEGPDGAAAVLGVHASTLRSRMKKLGVVAKKS